jgi:hypothetical protein
MPPRPGSTSPPSSKGGGRWPATAHRRYAAMYSRHSSSMEEGEAHVQLPPPPLRPRSIAAHHPLGGEGGRRPTYSHRHRSSLIPRRSSSMGGGRTRIRSSSICHVQSPPPVVDLPPPLSLNPCHSSSMGRGGGGGPTAATVPAATNGTDAEDLLACRLRDSGIDRERAAVRERERR